MINKKRVFLLAELPYKNCTEGILQDKIKQLDNNSNLHEEIKKAPSKCNYMSKDKCIIILLNFQIYDL